MDKKHLLYINLDGFGKYYFHGCEARFPNLAELVRHSMYFEDCHSLIPSITVPMQCCIVSGTTSKYTNNCYQFYCAETGRVVKCGRHNNAQTVAELLSGKGYSVLSVQQFSVENHGCSDSDMQHLYLQPGGDCRNRFSLLRDYYSSLRIGNTQFGKLHDMVMLYADDLDTVGHNYIDHQDSEESRVENVRKRLEVIDEELGLLFDVLRKNGLIDEIVILITADHGMVGYHSPSALPELIDDLQKISGVVVSTSLDQKPDIFLLPGTIECQMYFLNKAKIDEKTIYKALGQLDYVEKVMDKDELECEGVMPEFADMLVSPVEGKAFYADEDNDPDHIFASHDSLNDKARKVFALIFSSGENGVVVKEKFYINNLMNIALKHAGLPLLPEKRESA